MPNDEALGPRKTMFVLVIVVGCFAVLWPRILSPLMMGSRDHVKPNHYDREAGCCEVIFETEVAVLELVNEVCNSAIGVSKLNPYTAAECRKAVNETCGFDIAAFLKRTDNVGKSTKLLMDTMKNSNSSCLREHFGVPVYSLNSHPAMNSWTLPDTVKQERPVRGMGPHPALRERGRAIPPGPPPPSRPTVLPPHIRVRSPLSVYYELEIQPPPIPGMRPPLGSPGGPVAAPKSSMGFVMPIYTICIIVFFVYTLSKILFKRTGSPYDQVVPDPQFRRRVFRDDSRSSPDKLVVTAISGLVAEVQQQMEAGHVQNQQRQEDQENARPYTNGTIILNSGPVHIVTSEYRDKDKSLEPAKEPSPEPIVAPEDKEVKESSFENETSSEPKEPTPEKEDIMSEPLKEKESIPEPVIPLSEEAEEEEPEAQEVEEKDKPIAEEVEGEEKPVAEEVEKDKESVEEEVEEEELPALEEINEEEPKPEEKEIQKGEILNGTDQQMADFEHTLAENKADMGDMLSGVYLGERNQEENHRTPENSITDKQTADFVHKLVENEVDAGDILTGAFIDRERNQEEIQRTLAQLAEALIGESDADGEDAENARVKVIGMEVQTHAADGGEVRALPPAPHPAPAPRPTHEAEQVQSIFLDTEIPQQSRVLVADFAENRDDEPKPTKNSPLVVSGKMTLSLIQDAPRETPERDPESTMDDFTTASALTQPAEKDDDLSDEEIEEEIEIEEIEEEVEEEEEEPEEPVKVKTANK